MALTLEHYRAHREACLVHANHCGNADAANIWRQLADNYGLLIELEHRALRDGALIARP